jgi:molybdopterin-containing oxidoreductase family iron-sulfur binding subunit
MDERAKEPYWMGLEDLAPATATRRVGHEFPDEPPAGAAPARARLTRRDLFRVLGLSGAAVACTRAPVEKVIPYLVEPEEITPGVATWYATTCAACPAACGLLVKARDGRPIKIEGNPLHPSGGGVCATGQASILTLYDATRARGPSSAGTPVSWEAQDGEVRATLARLSAAGRAIRVVGPPTLGPSGDAAVARLLAAFPTAARVRFETVGTEAVALAHQRTHGVFGLPRLHLDRARLVVGIDADFLGTWMSPVAQTRGYAAARAPGRGERMLRHVQVEPLMSLTGCSADRRVIVRPSEISGFVAAVARRLGVLVPDSAASAREAEAARVADELAAAGPEGLVICGSSDVATQVWVNAIHERLGAYGPAGSTVAIDDATIWPDSLPFAHLLGELRRGSVVGLLILGVNPAFGHPAGAEIARLLGRVELTVSTADRLDETAGVVRHHAPAHHFLESWSDAATGRRGLSVRQPVLSPLWNSRAEIESLLRWAGDPRSAYDFVRARFEAEEHPRASTAATFTSFWDASVHDGVAAIVAASPQSTWRSDALADAAGEPSRPAPGGLELALFPPVGLRDGTWGNNGWLLELPDPVTKVAWTNALHVAPATAARHGLGDGDLVKLRAAGVDRTVPVVVQPGTHPDVVGLALGWGRRAAGPLGDRQGADAFALARSDGAGVTLWRGDVSIERAGSGPALPRTQVHASLEGRPLVHELSLAQLLGDPRAAVPAESRHESIWPRHAYPGHRWAMTIDLGACTGCGACLVSCQAENNVPIVGADEVRRGREMHWIRVDRYYAGPPDDPRVVHQPMMCQHCGNAPCETVCPVLATVHSSEGLSQQVYNRCVGTRYCANNCPYKTRRFNWFEPRHDDPVENLVLNPDVTVRSRGVMEKCSWCVQRIQAGKAQARREGRALRDGDIRTACEQSCPASAIVFGDANDPNSRVSTGIADGRTYRVLPELHVDPQVRYLARVRNPGDGA